MPLEKADLVQETMDRFPSKSKWSTKYDLVANICHEGKYGAGSNHAFVHHTNKQRYRLQDLHMEERMPQLVAVSQAYIQL